MNDPLDTQPSQEAVSAAKPSQRMRLLKALGLALLAGALALGLLLRTPGQAPKPEAPAAAPAAVAQPGLQDQIDALRLRVIVLEAQAAAAPARTARPRAAAPVAVSPADVPESPPPAPATAWGATDLDRALAAFPSTPSLEQAK